MNRTPLARLLALALLLAAGTAWAYEAGERVANFSGVDAAGRRHSLDDVRGKPVVLVVWSSKCPASRSYGPALQRLAKRFAGRAVFLGIAPSAGETPESVREGKRRAGIEFPVLLDAGGRIARSFGAVMTPSVYVIDGERILRYQGSVADRPRDPKQPHLERALEAVLAGRRPPRAKTRVVGFRIQY
ncbi:MAG: hypothetical protein D6731_22905 [Planctomycetota bacterium]|nr:MAG: hypothetical protein D6731_22905 [Planctomycetota bacterium]